MKKLLLSLLAVSLSIVLLGTSAQALSKIGSRGEEVIKIQTKLKRWGYYDGAIDGIYGTATKKAVELFQKKNGLKVSQGKTP